MRVLAKSSKHDWLIDALTALLLWGIWFVVVWRLIDGRRVILWDTFRDIAWAENIRAGRVWSDPTHPGADWWYPPGSPLLMAGLARLTGCSVTDLYGYSALWLNGWLPVLLYLALRQGGDRTTALVTLGTVLAGSFTWLTHAAAAIPSFQGIVFNLLGLLCWQRCCRLGMTTGLTSDGQRNTTQGESPDTGRLTRRKSCTTWALLSGLLLALSAWFHPLCAGLLAGAVLFQALITWRLKMPQPPQHGHRLAPALLVIAVGLALSAPLVRQMLRLHTQSPALARFFADELLDPVYYAHALTPLIVPAALAGVWIIVVHRTALLWAVGYVLIGQLGLIAGYLAQRPGWEIPFLLPHEFLWHAQLGLGICAAVALVETARRCTTTVPRAGVGGRRCAAALLVLFTLVVVPGLRGCSHAGKYLIDLEPLLAHTADLRAWIRDNTALEDVFVCPPDVGYCVIAGLTGRKCVAVSPGHSNPTLDYQTRHDDVRTMLETDQPEILSALARRYRARYLALVTPPGDGGPVVPHLCADQPILETVFCSQDGSAVVYRLKPDAEVWE